MAETPYTVSYNGQQPWLSGVPFVSMEAEEVYVAGQIGTIRTVTLNGTLPSSGAAMITGLQSVFATNFKTFSAPNVVMPSAIVKEVSFGAQNYIGKVDYTIVLQDFTGFLFGVTNPVDEVSFQNERDGSVTITHRVGALGISTGNIASSAWDNACSFVRARTGLANVFSFNAAFTAGTNSGSAFLVSQQESIDRVKSSYNITETFKYDPLRSTATGIFRRFIVDFNSGIAQDYIQVEVAGTYSMGSTVWDTGIFWSIASGELYALAFAASNSINPIPLSFGGESSSITRTIGGATGTRTLTFKALYDSSPSASFFDYDIEGSKDFRVGISQLTVRGVIEGSGRHVRRKYSSALSFFNTTVGGWDGARNYLYAAAVSGATDIGYISYPLNPTPKSFSVSFNSGLGTITMSASYDDAPFASGYSQFDWSVNADCGLNIFKPHPSANINGAYTIQDLNIVNRTLVTLNGSFAKPLTGALVSTTEGSDILVYLKALEGTDNAFLESESYNNTSGTNITSGFNYSYSKEGNGLQVLPTDGKIYIGI